MKNLLFIPIVAYIIIVGAWISFNGYIPTSDAAFYVCGAQNILDGNGYKAYSRHVVNDGDTLKPVKRFPIGYPFFIAIISFYFNNAYIGACVLTFIIGLISVILLYYLSLQFAPKIVATVIATIWATATYVMSPVISLWSEPIAVCLVMASTLFYMKKQYFLSAIFAGIAYTTRHTMSAFCIALAIDAILNKDIKIFAKIALGGVIGGGGIIIYNLLTFNTICPYHGPPPDYTFLEHLKTAGINILKCFTPLLFLAYKPKNIPRLVYIYMIAFTVVTLYGVNKYATSPLHYRLLVPIFWCILLIIASQWKRPVIKIFLIILLFWNMVNQYHWWRVLSKDYPRPYIEEPLLPAVSEDHAYFRAKYNYNVQINYAPNMSNEEALEKGLIKSIVIYEDGAYKVKTADSATER